MMNNSFLLQDRIQKIQQIIEKYGESNFFISYSGGKDSNVLDKLFDLALPENKIPRVYCDTGIELQAVKDFVKAKAAKDDRVIIIRPKTPIKQMLEEEGYPFKSKVHSWCVGEYQRDTEGKLTAWKKYYDCTLWKNSKSKNCPAILKYQFEDRNALDFKVSDKCCDRLKKSPLKAWQKENNRPYSIIGLVREEGGRRYTAQCLAFSGDKLKAFQPLVAVTKDWEEWFIGEYNIKLPAMYYPPYNFTRTGCKGCPFAIDLQYQLDILKEYFPGDYRQCEAIWKPVYDEYRRLGYRLKNTDQLTFWEG